MSDQILQLAEEWGKAWDALKASYDRLEGKMADLEEANAGEQAKANRQRTFGSTGGTGGANRGEVLNALRTFGRTGEIAPLAAMSVNSDPDGGYLVHPEISDTITRTAIETSPMRDLSRVVQIQSSSWIEPVADALPNAEWVSETQARNVTDHGELAQVEIPAHELMAMPELTQKLLDDASFDVGTFLEREIALKLAQAEATAFVAGDGVGKPRGFLSHDSSTADDDSRPFWTLQHVVSGAASDITTFDPLIDMMASMNVQYRPNAAWLMNRSTLGLLRKIKDGESRMLLSPDLRTADTEMLLGFPIRLAEDMPDVASNSFPIALGNFSRGYVIADRVGIRLLRDPFSRKGFVRFYVTKRVGGGLIDSKAIKLLKVST